jgi:hypothetical protein
MATTRGFSPSRSRRNRFDPIDRREPILTGRVSIQALGITGAAALPHPPRRRFRRPAR